MLLRARGVGVDKAWGSMQKDNAPLRILCGEMVKCQACQEGGMVDYRAKSPVLIEVQIIFINLGLLGAVEDGQDVRGTLATLG